MGFVLIFNDSWLLRISFLGFNKSKRTARAKSGEKAGNAPWGYEGAQDHDKQRLLLVLLSLFNALPYKKAVAIIELPERLKLHGEFIAKKQPKVKKVYAVELNSIAHDSSDVSRMTYQLKIKTKNMKKWK